MLKEFKSFVEKHNLISKDDRVLLALSGGVDSMVLAKLLLLSQQSTDNGQRTSSTTQQLGNSATQQLNLVTEPVEVPTANSQQTSSTTQQLSNSATQQLNNQQLTSVRFLLEDNYVLDYNFEKRPQPVKESGLQFNEPEFVLPETYESVVVGDVVKKKIDEVLEEGLTPTKLLIYFLCGAIGLSIGFLIVYFMGK